MTDEIDEVHEQHVMYRKIPIIEESKVFAADLLEYAQATGHYKLSLGDIIDQFDCGVLTAKLTRQMFREMVEALKK